MSIAGRVSGTILARHSHVRMEAKRRTLDETAARQRTAYQKRHLEAQAPRRASTAVQQPGFSDGRRQE